MSLRNIVTCFPLSENHADQIRKSMGADYRLIISSQEAIGEDIFAADIFCGHAKFLLDWPGVVNRGRLKWIQSSAAGLDHCLVPAVINSSIVVSGCSGLFANQVAEQAVALLAGLVRRLPLFFRAQQRKEYIRRPTDDLFGKVVGIVGFGGNGLRIAEVLRPLVGKIYATDAFPEFCSGQGSRRWINQILGPDGLETMLPKCDIVIVTLPLTAANENRISDGQFRKFKSGAYLINVGRGSVVNTESLIRTLQTGHLAGAGIDVVDPEPLPADSPLWEMENVIITPHVGAQSELRLPATVDLFCENISLFRSGKTLRNLVDKKLGFPRPEDRLDFDEN